MLAELARLQHILAQGPTPLFATVSGAHLYGFESPDSDWDLRGAFVAPLGDAIGLKAYDETVSILEDRDGLELDWVAHDVAKFARLMMRRNGYVLEQVFSPLVVHGGAWLDELRELARGCIVRPLFHHYIGFATNQRRLLEGGDATVKRMLYCHRVLLTGIHVLERGEIEASLPRLLDMHSFEGAGAVREWIEAKRQGAEKQPLEASAAERHAEQLDALTQRLEDAHDKCTLPDKPTTYDALHDFVVRARLELGQ